MNPEGSPGGGLVNHKIESHIKTEGTAKRQSSDVFVSLEDCTEIGTSTTPNPPELTRSKSACYIPEKSTVKSVPRDGQDMQLLSKVCKYACTHCDYKSSQKCHLTEHMRTHTGEKTICL